MVNELIYHQLNKHVKSLMHNYRKIVIKSYPDDKTIFCSLCVYCLPSFNDRIIFLKDPTNSISITLIQTFLVSLLTNDSFRPA